MGELEGGYSATCLTAGKGLPANVWHSASRAAIPVGSPSGLANTSPGMATAIGMAT
jgi:hypothetical protein